MKDYYKNAIAYYKIFLMNEGYSDPNRVIISDLIETLEIDEKQKEFLESNCRNHYSTLEDINILLKKTIKDKKYDENIFKLIVLEIEKILKDVK